MPYLARLLAAVGFLAGGGQGGWFQFEPVTLNATNQQDNQTLWEAWADWAHDRYEQAASTGEGWIVWASTWTSSPPSSKKGLSWDGGLCFLLDTIVGIIGWTLFGNAWPGVRTGCQRAFRIVALLVFCLVAHYLWALCWPVVSLCSAVILTAVWLVRALVRKVGTLVYWAQRAAGGVPEATGASFMGPGTGRIPETADLRNFKKVGSTEKWVLVRREGRVAVFKVGADSQTIRSAGLYVPVEPDTWRGDAEVIDACAGHDKIHLCRSLQCGEDGQHFKEYSLAKEFDAEKFQLRGAELGAAEAGKTLWAWMWSSRSSPAAKRPLEFCSESEPEEALKCLAHQVRWSDNDQDHVLCRSACNLSGVNPYTLLDEDAVKDSAVAPLCPKHALEYEQKRRCHGCRYSGCQRLGVEECNGVWVCKVHGSSRRSSSRKRSPARTVGLPEGGDPEEPELPALRDEGPRALRDLRRVLDDVKGEDARTTRPRLRSPGNTPKSSIQRNLAKLGLLDSPNRPELLSVLEDFFHQYAEGRDLGLSEEEVRQSLASERSMTLPQVTTELLQEALREQARGQQGLSKFIRVWQRQGGIPSSTPSSARTAPPSWEMVEPPPSERSAVATTPPSTPLRIRSPGIYGQEDRKAGAVEGQGQMDDIARAIQSQTAEIASLVKNHTDANAVPAGTIKGLNRVSEELVFLLRACNQYQVTIGAGEQGQALANALLSAQVGASTRLRRSGFKQKVTTRLAVGLAGPYWGTQDKHALTASDFVAHTDAELDAFVQELRTNKPGHDQRPAPPNKIEDWEARVRRQNDVWALVYGMEWKPVRNHALALLLEWHQAEPHKWPLSVVSEIWEELHWRFLEELKETLRLLKKEANRETMSLQDIKFYALLPNSDGKAWLELPRTFDLKNPDGWFMAEVLPRIERRQERVLWRLTWEGGRGAKQQGVVHAGGGDPDKKDRPTPSNLWGPKMTTEEVNRAKDRAPTDKDGTLLCWGALTHMGCSTAACQRSHADLQGRWEALDPCVRMQLLRRGGLRRMKAETKDTVAAKVKAIRAEIAKDKADKIADGRKSGQNPPPAADSQGETRAGGDKVVRVWDVPEEFEAVDFTTAEQDMREKLKGPDIKWLVNRDPLGKTLAEATGETAPDEAKDYVQRAQELANGPVLSRLTDASDDLYAWAAARVARKPQASFEEVLSEMATYGLGEMAEEATKLLETALGTKAGSTGSLQVMETVWEHGQPGKGTAIIEGEPWIMWDFKEEIPMGEELAALLEQAEAGVERRQCVTKTVAAGIVWRAKARRPTLEEVADKAAEIRLDQARQAVEAKAAMGEAEARVAPIEAEIRIYTHDMIRANHDKDFRSHAVFPTADLEDCKLVVIRADYKGDIVMETVTGTMWQDGGWVIWTLIWRGHMVLLEPPDGTNVGFVLDKWQPHDTPALGFLFFWDSRYDQERTSPGTIFCRLCKPARKAGERVFAQEVLGPRKDSNLAAAAIVGCIRAGASVPGGLYPLRGRSLCFQEVFAGSGVMTQGWLRAGVRCMEPIEVYEEPHLKQGYRAAFDLTLPDVRQRLLYQARDGQANVWWLAGPCTSFCDWNNGTRSFQRPEGGSGGRPLTESEEIGNILSEVEAVLFETCLESGAFPIAESTARSGRYPKMWDLPCWRRILARPDVQWVEFPMCAFGLGPEDEEGFYHHKTRLAFPRCEPLAAALSRRCPGVGAAHRHIPLKGSRPGSNATRCTEAGVYALDFVEAVVSVLTQVLCAGGKAPQMASQMSSREQEDPFSGRAGQPVSPSQQRQSCRGQAEHPLQQPQSCQGQAKHPLQQPQSCQGQAGQPPQQPQSCQGQAGQPPQQPQTCQGQAGLLADPFLQQRRSGHELTGHPPPRQDQLEEQGEVNHGCRAGGASRKPGWLDDIWDDDQVDFQVTKAFAVCGGRDTRAGSLEGAYEAPSEAAKKAAEDYIGEVTDSGNGEPRDWKAVCRKGSDLLDSAGSVEGAAKSLWQVRELRDLNNLRGVDEPYLDTILHPDLLAYLRDVRERGLAARCLGPRERQRAKLHPNARRNVDQLYRQIWKDVAKQRVLVVPSAHELLQGVVASPFDAVDKMLPDRTIAADKRVVHDQRGVNALTDKEWHPPAVQPKHVQIARLVLWHKCQCPGVEVLLSKKDIAGAFRLLWLDPRDVALFAGELPWLPSEMEGGEQVDGGDITVIYLVSSFGFSGSPGEWSVWGRATEDFLTSHRPANPRRDLSATFTSRILVDDNVLVEPYVGLRPWVAAEVYEKGVKTMLGNNAVNAEKDNVEGPFRTFQTVWGLVMETSEESVHLPEKRIMKGAVLLSDPCFDYGCKEITVRTIQRFRGIATGWAVIVPGLKNELKAADRFIGPNLDGNAKAVPKVANQQSDEEVDQAWRDLWELFEATRWLCARPETWSSKFGAGLRELLPVRERLAIPGAWQQGVVFVSSDATRTVIGAIDWTNGFAMRMKAGLAAKWVDMSMDDDEVAIHVAEMLSFLAFACKVGEKWYGKVVLYGGDNQVVREWIEGRKSGTVVGRLLVRILNMLEMRYRCVVVAAWWRTYHNVHADYITRCTSADFEKMAADKGWAVVDVEEELRQAIEDSQLFGPTLLAWHDADRRELLHLKGQRLKRQVPSWREPSWSALEVVELAGQERFVFDFVTAAFAMGCQARTATWAGPVKRGEIVLAAFPPDMHGKVATQAAQAAIDGEAAVAVFEGPRNVAWDKTAKQFLRSHWFVHIGEFVTSEFGEAAVRRRVCLVASQGELEENPLECTTSRSKLGPPMSPHLDQTRAVEGKQWIGPVKITMDGGIPREPLLPMIKGHFWEEGKRKNLIGTGGPLLWPLRVPGEECVEPSVVWDPRGPSGRVRKLTAVEVWRCQGRTDQAFKELLDQGHSEQEILVDGNRATGGQVASALVVMSGFVVGHARRKAGGCGDYLGDENLAKILEWLGRWRRGFLPRGHLPSDERRAGGCGGDDLGQDHRRPRFIWAWIEDLLWGESSEEEGGASVDSRTKAGGKRGQRVATEAVSVAVGEAQVRDLPGDVCPFDGAVGARIDEWVEENLTGYLAESTTRQYSGVYGKWRAWARRQGWMTEHLDKSLPAEANEDKLLSFLGYLGWLGCSVATLKQAVFAVKDAHKRAGKGDPTERMFRLWMLLGALEKRSPKKPRRLGVTPAMLRWIADLVTQVSGDFADILDGAMLNGAVQTAWFFMLRAKEYSDSNGVDFMMIIRGVDIKFVLEEGTGKIVGVTLQFRKTKVDQEAFGTCKTFYGSGIPEVCVVTALKKLETLAPQRFGTGSEALKPLFRWSNGQVLKRVQVQNVLQKAAVACGLPAGRFMTHSLRIGGASALFQATGEIELVKRTGRWTSAAVQRYLHDGEIALKDCAEKMAKVRPEVHYT